MKNYLQNLYSQISRREKHWIFRLIDCLSIGFSIYFAFSLRFDLFSVGNYLNQYLDPSYCWTRKKAQKLSPQLEALKEMAFVRSFSDKITDFYE